MIYLHFLMALIAIYFIGDMFVTEYLNALQKENGHVAAAIEAVTWTGVQLAGFLVIALTFVVVFHTLADSLMGPFVS